MVEELRLRATSISLIGTATTVTHALASEGGGERESNPVGTVSRPIAFLKNVNGLVTI